MRGLLRRLRLWLTEPRPAPRPRCQMHDTTPRELELIYRYSTHIICTCRPITVTATPPTEPATPPPPRP